MCWRWSNAIGVFHPFIDDETVELIGVEAGGKDGSDIGASISDGSTGVLHGAKTKYYSQTQEIFSKQIQFQLV